MQHSEEHHPLPTRASARNRDEETPPAAHEAAEPGMTSGSAPSSLVASAADAVSARLAGLGVRLTGRESADDLANLLEAVERFETTVERAGADLLVDEPIRGASTPLAPDDATFVLPRRRSRESVAHFIVRVAEAAASAERSHRRGGGNTP